MPRVRTGYSFRAAAGHLNEAMDRLKAIGGDRAPITDRASTFGYVRWTKAAKKAGLKPVYGIELAVTNSINAKKPTFAYWTFLAIDDIESIHQLLKLATRQFHYEPVLTYEQAMAAEGVFRVAGHETLLDEVSPDPKTFIALGPSSARGFIRKADSLGLQFAACSDNKYVNAGDGQLYEVLIGRNASTQSYPQHILSDEEWNDYMLTKVSDQEFLDIAKQNTRDILKSCNAHLKKAKLLTPEKAKSLRQMCIEGAQKLDVDLDDPVYAARLDRELALIADKQFEDYFFIIADMMEWARERLLCGPARGSSCGSLVCYLLAITTIDPIPHGLVFERFISVDRADLPDIDLDFSDQRRQLVFDYMANKYGGDRVARLGTVAMYKPRSAIQETGAALRVPRWKCDAVTESLIERSSGDSRALQALEDTFHGTVAGQEMLAEYPEMIIAARMEGHPRHHSQHAAGIVVTERPVIEFVAVDERTGATHCDKKDAEELNLLKIDALGLTQLSVFEDALELAHLPRLHLDTLPLDDQAAFDVLNKKQWSGVFQFNGMAPQSLAKQIHTECFNDIVSMTALARPGPLTTGGAHQWVKRRNKEAQVEYPHEIFKPQLEDTLGVVVYQEQIMTIGKECGDLSWEDVSELRRAMSKSLGEEYFNKFGDRWKQGVIAKGVSPEVANKFWSDLCAYGAWCFNKSHAVAYGLISYWCCWMKAHHPHEFAAATLQHENDPAKQIAMLREMNAEGIDYVPVDPAVSIDRWTVSSREGKKILVGPVNNVIGIGPKLVSAIVSSRARNEPLPPRAAKLLASPKTPIDTLWPIRDGIRRMLPNPADKNILTPPTLIINAQNSPETQEFLFFCTFSKINPRDENEVIMVARRGGKRIDGDLTTSLNLQVTDDTDTIFGKINRFDYPSIGKAIVDRGRVNKALYAVKGTMRGGMTFRMISIKAVRYIGDLSDD